MWVLIRAGYKVRTFIKRPALLKYAGYDMEFLFGVGSLL